MPMFSLIHRVAGNVHAPLWASISREGQREENTLVTIISAFYLFNYFTVWPNFYRVFLQELLRSILWHVKHYLQLYTTAHVYLDFSGWVFYCDGRGMMLACLFSVWWALFSDLTLEVCLATTEVLKWYLCGRSALGSNVHGCEDVIWNSHTVCRSDTWFICHRIQDQLA